jgi:hypothetical protein
MPGSSYGPILVKAFGTWGRVCAAFWDNDDAGVLCRQLGFHGGIAVAYPGIRGVPVLLTEVLCNGNETTFDSCSKSEGVCYSAYSGGAICYQSSGM